jgi:RIO kinase 1
MLTDIDAHEALEGFFLDKVIDEVVGLVKGGKEAVVYLVRKSGDPPALYAAKIYKDSVHRTFRNDADYRAGRWVGDERIKRAIARGSDLGRQAWIGLWRGTECEIMHRVHQAGARVPQFVRAGANAILMEYIGDEEYPAPLLRNVRLPRDEAERVFDQVLEDLDIFLEEGVVHGDLSAYNMLWWQGEVIIIDFPQSVDLYKNPNAPRLLARDLQNLVRYFAKQGVDCSVLDLMERYERLVPWREMPV